MLLNETSNEVGPEESPPLPEHLERLEGGEWCLWKWVGLRGAGFPASEVLKLAAPYCGRLANEVVQAEDDAENAWRAALQAVDGELMPAGEVNSNLLEKAKRRLQKGKLPEITDLSLAITESVKAFACALHKVDEAWSKFHDAFDSARAEASEAIQEIARSSAFREAIVWQNRHVLHTAIEPLIRKSPAANSRDSRQRQHEELIASYLQRYGVKNDTIGFFGPIGWARVVSQGEAVTALPGQTLTATRQVYFEGWCVDALADALSSDAALRPWIAPRRSALTRLEADTLYQFRKSPLKLSTEEVALLKAINGERVAKEIVGLFIDDPSLGLKSEEEVYKLLQRLCDEGAVSWNLQIPYNPRSEISLRRKLERIGDEQLRNKTLGALDELERAKAAVAEAAGDAQKLDEAMQELEATFTRLTGSAATRNEGKTYAGRTLVYEDCRRDIEVEIGRQVLKELGPALSLLLTSARWVTYKVGEQYRSAFAELYRQMVHESGSPTGDAVEFWFRSQRLLIGENKHIVESVSAELQRRWSEILSITPGQREVSYSSEQLRRRVIDAFDTPRPGWQFGRYNSPDVMIAASSVEDIRSGNYQVLLGEMHIGLNTLVWSMFTEQHPHIEELIAAIDSDMARPRLIPVSPKYQPGFTSRGSITLVSPKDYRLEFSLDASGAEHAQILHIAELLVEEKDGGLIVRTRDGRLQFDVLEAFGDALSWQVVDAFKILTAGEHTPRVSIDRLVVSRESWKLLPSDMEFAFEKDEAQRFVEASRFRRRHCMPRQVFVKSPVEVKPFYVDFDSALLVNLLSKVVRQSEQQRESEGGAGVLTMTEMVPGPEQVWLPDASGNLYTSELRIVTIDFPVDIN